MSFERGIKMADPIESIRAGNVAASKALNGNVITQNALRKYVIEQNSSKTMA